MRDAAVERLAKLISDKNTESPEEEYRSRFELRLGLAEGWFSLALVAIIVYSTILCVQTAGWVDHLDRLTFTTLLGLIIGIVAAKQERFPRFVIHLLVLVFGLLFAFWQTAGAFFEGSTSLFVGAIERWVAVMGSGGATDDDSIFLFLIIALSFLLSYTSVWLVYRTRSPWLMIVANAVVILINLNNSQNGNVVFLVVFLMAALLLLLRFNLYESIVRWRRQGLRYAEDITWDFMQAGAFISIGILVFSWILPGNYTDPLASQVWNNNGSPLVFLQNTWNRAISVNNASTPANHGSFQKELRLGGNPNLTNVVVMTVKSDDDKQYLASLAYDTYNGRGWTNAGTVDDTLKVPANLSYSSGAQMVHSSKQKVTIVNPPDEGQYAYLFGASEISQVSLPTKWLSSSSTGAIVAWVNQNGRLAQNMSYSVVSNVSSADLNTLRTVPLPKDAPPYPTQTQVTVDVPIPTTAYTPSTLATNAALPKELNPAIKRLAESITARESTMYDKVVALETYLRQNYTYNLNIQLPAGKEGVNWFLFESKKGFCNYFASAMTVMARSLGIPARVMVGYTNGTYDTKTGQRVIRGVDAHAWTQVYFAGYGWINFEPSATFATFNRPLPNQYGASAAAPPADITGNTDKNTQNKLRDKDPQSSFDPGNNTTASPVRWEQPLSVALGTLLLFVLFASIIFGIWWRRLFRNYNLSAQIFGRLCLLGDWAGIRLQRSQTPYEYARELSAVAPEEKATLERLSDIYVRDRWADPQSSEHPLHSGEVGELPGMWKRLEPRFLFYVVRHPDFLRWLPRSIGRTMATRKRRRRMRRELHAEEL